MKLRDPPRGDLGTQGTKARLPRIRHNNPAEGI